MEKGVFGGPRELSVLVLRYFVILLISYHNLIFTGLLNTSLRTQQSIVVSEVQRINGIIGRRNLHEGSGVQRSGDARGQLSDFMPPS